MPGIAPAGGGEPVYEYVPTGATSVIIELWGAGGSGGGAFREDSVGGGGGSGAYCKKTIAVMPDDWGGPIFVAISDLYIGGNNTPSPGNPGSPGAADDANTAAEPVDCLGNIGLYAGDGGGGTVVLSGVGSPGGGGTTSSGDVNINGNSGVGQSAGVSVFGGFGGGGEGWSQNPGDDGGPGHIRFTWS